MDSRVLRNRRFLTDLFAGPFPGHAIIVDPEPVTSGLPGDVSCSERPVAEWLDHALQDYEAQVQRLDDLDHDGVPTARIMTGTQLFAAAFGCPVHIYPDSPPAARPLVSTAAEADRLTVPPLDAPPLARCFELGRMLRDRLGPQVPIRVPDIQSPFDIAALIWRKQDFYLAMLDSPAAVKRLVEKCTKLLTCFLQQFMREFGEVNLCHCPNAWAPPQLGCWLSEDEAGAMSVMMFEEFCLPVLTQLSNTFGGLFVHCCATADHQYVNFVRIPNLRGMNRVFQEPGPRPAVEAFSGRTVLMLAWMSTEQFEELLQMALPTTRYLFNVGALPTEEARQVYERLRDRCPRRAG